MTTAAGVPRVGTEDVLGVSEDATGAPGSSGRPRRQRRRSGLLVRYALKRLLFAIPQLVGATIVTFFIVRIGGADPAVLQAGPQADESTLARIRAEQNLDDPLWTQYWTYITNALQGDLGTSWVSQRAVTTEIRDRLPATLEMATYGIIWAVVLGVVLGVIAATYRGRVADHVARFVTIAGISLPVFWIGLMLLFVFTFRLGWTPAPFGRLDRGDPPPPRLTGAYTVDALLQGQWSTFASAAAHLILPVITIAIVAGCAIAKQVRATVVEVRDSQPVRYANAMGVPRRKILKMILHLITPTVLTFVAISYGLVLGGSALLEKIFTFGGLGQFGIDAVTQTDFAVVQGYVLVLAVLTILAYLVVDVVNAMIDPRVELS